MKRKLAAVFSVALIAGATVSGTTPAKAIDLAEICTDAGLLLVAGVCTHGGDLGLLVDASVEGAEVPVAPCVGDGVSGKRIEVLYAYPADRPNKYTETRPAVRKMMAKADLFLDESTLDVDQHFRFLCNSDKKVIVRKIKVKAVGSDNTFTFADFKTSVANAGYNRTDRIYLGYIDHVTDVYEYGGQGSLELDDQASTSNANNTGPAYSMTAFLNGGIALHELGHNLGAVQNSAKHSSGAGHCYDENDEMCYADGGSYFDNGGELVNLCPDAPDWKFDCKKNDYYDPYPGGAVRTASGVAIWNTAISGFLSPPSKCSNAC